MIRKRKWLDALHVLPLVLAALLACVLLLSAASASDGFDFLRRRLWSASRFLQLFFESSNSSSRWNLNSQKKKLEKTYMYTMTYT
jgi:peptidoglycan/LPS O-acetylase OafA/YrhL